MNRPPSVVVHITTAGGAYQSDPLSECAPSAPAVVRRSGPHQSVSATSAPGPGDGNPGRPAAHPSPSAPTAQGIDPTDTGHKTDGHPGHAPKDQQ